MKILFASNNKHKFCEAAAILSEHKLVFPLEAGLSFAAEESGASFLENALIKARAAYHLAPPGIFDAALSDDSGLCVEALGGEPGIHSARYGEKNGQALSSHEKNLLLLGALTSIKNRAARFVSCCVIYFNEARFAVVEESVEGEILEAERGKGGFGYDPLFFLPDAGKTMAELSDGEKNAASHRGKALRSLAALLR